MAKFAHELEAIPKLDRPHTQAPRSDGICADVVYEKDSRRRSFRGADCSAEDLT